MVVIEMKPKSVDNFQLTPRAPHPRTHLEAPRREDQHLALLPRHRLRERGHELEQVDRDAVRERPPVLHAGALQLQVRDGVEPMGWFCNFGRGIKG